MSWALCVALALVAASARAGDDRLPGVVRVGIDFAFPPHQFVDEQGEPTGFDVELVRAALEAAGLRYEIQAGPWAEIRAALERGDLDVCPGVVRTDERDRLLDFSVLTAPVRYTAFVRDDSSIRSRADLAGKRVFVVEATVAADVADTRIPGLQRVVAPTAREALERLSAGEADAALLLDLLGLYLVRTHELPNVRSIGVPVARTDYRFAVPDGSETLLAALNDGLHQLRDTGRYDAIFDHWFGVLQPRGMSTRQALALVGGAALLLVALAAASVLWTRTLRRQVGQRTQQLIETDAVLRATLAAAPNVGFVVTEGPGEDAPIVDFSEGAARVFGLSREVAQGQPLTKLRSELPDAASGASESHESLFLRASGEVFPAFEVRTPLPGEDGAPLRTLHVVFDLTDRERAEEEKRQLERRLLDARNAELVGQLAGGAAHDLRNVLAGVMGGVDLARSCVDDRAALTETLDAIRDTSRAASDLLDQLLSVGRRPAVELRLTTWNDVIGRARPMLRGLVPPRIRLQVDTADEPLPIRIDLGRASQVVVNLVANARDAIRGAGTIRVETGAEQVDGRDWVVLAVSDDGEGMDEETRSRAFEAFYTTRAEDGGTGLGLATVRVIVDELGGHVEVESREGEGSSFRVLLPRAEPQPLDAD